MKKREMKNKWAVLLCIVLIVNILQFTVYKPIQAFEMSSTQFYNPEDNGGTTFYQKVYYAGREWRVLENANNELFLMTERSVFVMLYNVTPNNNYRDSDAREYLLNGFLSTFTSKEIETVLSQKVFDEDGVSISYAETDENGDKVFLLSVAETTVEGTFSGGIGVPFTSEPNERFPNGNDDRAFGNWWYLRTPDDTIPNIAMVSSSGSVSKGYHVDTSSVDTLIVPALKLNLNDVLFTSPIVDGKANGNFHNITPDKADTVKLTLKDKTQVFSADMEERTAVYGTSLTLNNYLYSGVPIANGYISVIFENEKGDIYYNKIAAASGSSTGTDLDFSVKGIPAGNYKAKVFTEQANGTTETDYASNVVEFDVVIEKAIPEATFPIAADITYGQTLGSSALTGGVGDGSFAWLANWSERVPEAGIDKYQVVFTPNDMDNYLTVDGLVTINVLKHNPYVQEDNKFTKKYGEIGDLEVAVELIDAYFNDKYDSFSITVTIDDESVTLPIRSNGGIEFHFSNEMLNDLPVGEYNIIATAGANGANNGISSTTVGKLIIVKSDESLIVAEDVVKNYLDEDFVPEVSASENPEFTFVSGNEDVAVIVDGKIQIVGAGTATITVTSESTANYEEATTTFLLTVRKIDNTIAPIDSVSAIWGDEPQQLVLSANENPEFTLVSSNPEVVEVTLDGQLIFKKAGTAIITVNSAETANYKEASIQFSVNVGQSGGQSIATQDYNKVYGDENFTVSASAKEDAVLSFSSNNPLIQVDSVTGEITINGAGVAEITIKATATENYTETSAKCLVTVDKAEQVIAGLEDIEFTAKENVPELNPISNADETPNFSYYSSNTTVIDFDENGNMIVKRTGKAVITVTADETANYKGTSVTFAIEVIADKSELEEVIKDGEAIDNDDYIEEYWEDLQEKLEDGREILKNPDASQEEVDEAVKKIKDAINALKKKPVELPSEEPITSDNVSTIYMYTCIISVGMLIVLFGKRRKRCDEK